MSFSPQAGLVGGLALLVLAAGVAAALFLPTRSGSKPVVRTVEEPATQGASRLTVPAAPQPTQEAAPEREAQRSTMTPLDARIAELAAFHGLTPSEVERRMTDERRE
jgi:hypothetical protein